MAEQTFCTPYYSRTIKGWKIRVRLCFSVDDSFATVDGLDAVYGAIPALLNGITNSTWYLGGSLGQQREYVYATSTSDYDNAEDVVTFLFATADGTQAKISVPNPKDSIFLADKMTVDPANPAVIAFLGGLNIGVSVLAGYPASTSAGGVLNTYLGGLRVRKRTRRKLNIWVRNPELSAPGI